MPDINDQVRKEFFEEIERILGDTANSKGYSTPHANPLMDFMDILFPDHALGEIIYKVVRYKSKRDPVDLIKIAAWACLLYEWRDK